MSHYIFKDKKVFALKDGRYMFLAKVADSSLRDSGGGHPAEWSIITDLELAGTLFLTKDEIHHQREKMIERQKERLADYDAHFGNDDEAPLFERYNYYGTTYRGSGKIRAMYSFYGIRKTSPIETLFGRFGIYIESYDSATYKTKDRWDFNIKSYADLEALNAKYKELCDEQIPRVIGITGIYD